MEIVYPAEIGLEVVSTSAQDMEGTRQLRALAIYGDCKVALSLLKLARVIDDIRAWRLNRQRRGRIPPTHSCGLSKTARETAGH